MQDIRDRMCFACGEDNPISLGLEFTSPEDNVVEAKFTVGEEHQGYERVMHGGLISTLLDEAMAKVITFNKERAFTAEMKVRFKRPVQIGSEVLVRGILQRSCGRLFITGAELKDAEGKLLARAEGKFMRVKKDT
ncbi:MAG: PaaI family thioesterase [Halanaerobiales bacterium]